MYYFKKYYLLAIGWFSSGSGKYCFYNRKCQVLRNGKEISGLIVSDKRNGPTIILCDDGIIQHGGIYRPV